MPEPADQPAKPLRTWRPMALWTAGLLLVLGLIWFVAAVVVPVFETRNVVRRCVASAYRTRGLPIKWDMWQQPHAAEKQAIDNLGGPQKAVTRLRIFRMAPDWVTEQGAQPDHFHFSNKEWSVLLLGYCGQSGTVELIPMLQDSREGRRILALVAVYRIGPEAAEAVSAVQRLLTDDDPWTRDAAAKALKKIRGEEAEK